MMKRGDTFRKHFRAQLVPVVQVGKLRPKEEQLSWMPVAHTCNPSFSGRDQEDRSSKPAQGNSSQDPILKNTITKKDWWSGSRCRP
jgi:hypothetical protein